MLNKIYFKKKVLDKIRKWAGLGQGLEQVPRFRGPAPSTGWAEPLLHLFTQFIKPPSSSL